MSIQDRLKAFISYLNISEREFCRTIGVSPTYVQTVGSKVKRSTLNAMQAAYPLLNVSWVLNGSGSMLLDEPAAPVVLPEEKKAAPVAAPANNNDMALRLLALVESQQRTLEDNAATIKRQTEELAALRVQLKALTEEGLKDVADVSSFRRAPSPAGSLV